MGYKILACNKQVLRISNSIGKKSLEEYARFQRILKRKYLTARIWGTLEWVYGYMDKSDMMFVIYCNNSRSQNH